MTRYTARAMREDEFWIIEVEGVGTTQALDLDEAMEMARDLVAAMRELPHDEIDMTLIAQSHAG